MLRCTRASVSVASTGDCRGAVILDFCASDWEHAEWRIAVHEHELRPRWRGRKPNGDSTAHVGRRKAWQDRDSSVMCRRIDRRGIDLQAKNCVFQSVCKIGQIQTSDHGIIAKMKIDDRAFHVVCGHVADESIFTGNAADEHICAGSSAEDVTTADNRENVIARIRSQELIWRESSDAHIIRREVEELPDNSGSRSLEGISGRERTNLNGGIEKAEIERRKGCIPGNICSHITSQGGINNANCTGKFRDIVRRIHGQRLNRLGKRGSHW